MCSVILCMKCNFTNKIIRLSIFLAFLSINFSLIVFIYYLSSTKLRLPSWTRCLDCVAVSYNPFKPRPKRTRRSKVVTYTFVPPAVECSGRCDLDWDFMIGCWVTARSIRLGSRPSGHQRPDRRGGRNHRPRQTCPRRPTFRSDEALETSINRTATAP